MRISALFFACLFLGSAANAQWKSFKLTPERDTLNRIDLKGMKQGPWLIHQDDLRGERGYEEEGLFVNNLKEGVWKKFSLDGDMIASENYSYGMKNGKAQYFTNAGELLREESWRAIDPNNPYDTVAIRDVDDPSKILRYQVIKVDPISYKHGTWTFYNTEMGTIESTEQWVMNRPKAEVDAETQKDDLAPIGLDGSKDAAAKTPKEKVKPKEVLDFEKKNSGKKQVKVRNGSTGG